jgi:hypothetical protein
VRPGPPWRVARKVGQSGSSVALARARSLSMEVGEPARGSPPTCGEVLAAARLRDPWQPLPTPSGRPPWNREVAGPFVRPHNGVALARHADKSSGVDPLRLDPLERPSQVRSDERTQPAIRPVFRQAPPAAQTDLLRGFGQPPRQGHEDQQADHRDDDHHHHHVGVAEALAAHHERRRNVALRRAQAQHGPSVRPRSAE